MNRLPRHITLKGYDHWIANCPYPPPVRMTLLEGTEKLTYASALFEAAARARGVPPMPQVDSERLPHLAEALAANPHDAEALFEQGRHTALNLFELIQLQVRINNREDIPGPGLLVNEDAPSVAFELFLDLQDALALEHDRKDVGSSGVFRLV